jgi:hypothetical protein
LNDRVAAHLHQDRKAKLCHFVRRNPTHLVLPDPWVPLYAPAFVLRRLATFEDPVYSQVHPPRLLRVGVHAVEGVRPPFSTGCLDPAEPRS